MVIPGSFETERIGRYGNLTLVMPVPEVIVASKLARAYDTDLEDAIWWTRGRDLTEDRIARTIDMLPQRGARDSARQNLLILRLAFPDPE